jgi:hypothetical protein
MPEFARFPGSRDRRGWRSACKSVRDSISGKMAHWISSACAAHVGLQYLDAVERHGASKMFSKDFGVHVEELEIAGAACAEPLAEQRKLLMEIAMQLAV